MRKPHIFWWYELIMNNNTLHPVAIQLPDEPAKTLVLFDFDGTLTNSDSLGRYLSFSLGYMRFSLGLPVVLLRFFYLLVFNKWGNGVAKQQLMTTYFKGKTRTEMETMGKAFIPSQRISLLNPTVLGWLRAYRDAGCRVAVVSASFDVWLQPFCSSEQIELICTRLEFKNDRFTGQYATPNCNYDEKANRIRAAFTLENYTNIIAYGNSKGDHAMFELTTEAWKTDRKGIFERYK